MPVSPEFRDHVLDPLRPLGGVTGKAMFGGFGLYRDGAIFGLIASDRVYFKSDAANVEIFKANGLKPFCPFPDRPVRDNPYTMGYYEPPESALEDGEELCHWARLGLEAAARSAKGKKKTAKTHRHKARKR